MKAAYYDQFGGDIQIRELPDPFPPDNGVVIKVMATGMCLSDWHGWMGHDPDIKLPHVPGHEFSGVIEEVGQDVHNWAAGDQVTLPFVCGCGVCPQCISGNQQVCDNQFQPGFTHWGSFAEYVAIERADINLVSLPPEIDFVAAAALGCRFVTSFRGVVDQGNLHPGQWVAVYGCGGVGLSAVMIASAMGGRVIGIDISDSRLTMALSLGAEVVLNPNREEDILQSVRENSSGGVHLSIDALGSPETCSNSIGSLRKRGVHVQIGLMVGTNRQQPVPMDVVIANELVIKGSHGIQAHRYPAIFELLKSGKISLSRLVGKMVSLTEGARILPVLAESDTPGVIVINDFR